MKTEKISISLSHTLYEFIEEYREEHHYKSRSDVIAKALRVLRQSQLEACYREASKEVDKDFESTAGDGLEEHEAW